MKQLLLLGAAWLAVLAIQAQSTDTYQMHVHLADGILHYATEDIQEMSVVNDEVPTVVPQDGQVVTDTYTAISVSGLSPEFASATASGDRAEVSVRLAGITLQAVSTTANWDERQQGDINFYYTLGTGNPYTTAGTAYQPDGSGGLPANGLYYRFMPKYDGVLKIGVWSNKNSRNTYIVEETTMLPVAYEAEGYLNGQNDAAGNKRFLTHTEIQALHEAAGVGPYVIGTGNFFWGWLTVTVEAGRCYWLFQDTSQIGFEGFTFTYTADGNQPVDDAGDQLLRIRQATGNIDISTSSVVKITFDRQHPAPMTDYGTMLDEAISNIPTEYADKATSRGRVVGVSYTTTSYATHQQVEKTAYVYLPWEYDYYPDRRYNILYLMHGMGDDATTYIYGNSKELRMAIDHLIQDSIIEPLIVVTPTFYAPGAGDANINMAATSFPDELLNDLMPAVESKYRTYATETTLEGFKTSRQHRAFGGFSMGSVTTWNVFSRCLPYIRDFIPMSGGMTMTTGGGSVAASLATVVSNAGLGAHDFYINAMSGSGDYAASGLAAQIDQMANTQPFVRSRDRSEGNIYYREWPGGLHEYLACITYVYNALYNLFR